jgi:hypothetical protein
MRRWFAALALPLGCGTSPYVVTSPVPDGDALSCASAQLTSMGYAVEPSATGANSVRGVRQASGGRTETTATVFAYGAGRSMRVSTESFVEREGHDLKRVGSPDVTRQDAEHVAAECGAQHASPAEPVPAGRPPVRPPPLKTPELA